MVICQVSRGQICVPIVFAAKLICIPALSQSAPTGTYVPLGTGVAGVPLAPTSLGTTLGQPAKHSSGSASQRAAVSADVLSTLACLAALLVLR